jgi:apolipoprotein N-acyltransferase
VTRETTVRTAPAPLAGHLPLSLGAGTLLLSGLLGAATVLGFAPFYLWPVPLLTLAGLARMVARAATPGRAAGFGYAFGFGYFITGVSWVFVSMHQYGGMSIPLAAFATSFFCAYLAVFPAAAAWLTARTPAAPALKLAVVFPAAWIAAEWVRSWMFTGFPWLAIGYAQSPSGPLSWYAPVFGVYGIGLVTAMTAGALAWWRPWRTEWTGSARLKHAATHPALRVVLLAWAIALGLQAVTWTAPLGEPVSVSLAQGNIKQDLKWRPEALRQTLDTYLELTRSSNARLIVLPETAVPLFDVEVPAGYLDLLAAHARANGGDILLGIPELVDRQPPRFYNSVISLGTHPRQSYRKHHLVPFGDYVPQWTFVTWVMDAIDIPMSSFSRGEAYQKPLEVAGQRVAVNICYEDVFGEEIIRQLPAATMLANFTNDAWWGDSAASEQHLQMAQTRAQETGRYMLRATNTGVTAIIDERGRVLEQAPEFVTTLVNGTARGFSGSTPYVRWGNWPVLALLALILVTPWLRRRR